MFSVPRMQIAVFGRDASDTEAIVAALEENGHTVNFHPLDHFNGVKSDDSLVIVDGSQREQYEQALRKCQEIKTKCAESLFLPILVILGDANPRLRLATLQHGADGYLLRPFVAAELLAHVNAFARINERHHKLIQKSTEIHCINRRLQTAYQQIDRELDLAARLQSSLLPKSVPVLPQIRFAVHHQNCGKVGGDFYDVFRLDEGTLGLYVADAMGHGIPASLLTVFVKKTIVTKEINGNSYRLLPPYEVLERLNQELIAQELADSPFITMIYATIDIHDGLFSFARAGHPYPLYIPKSGSLQSWKLDGTLLGVFDTNYSSIEKKLNIGDKILLFTDGVGGGSFEEEPNGLPSLMTIAHQLRDLPIDQLLPEVSSKLFAERSIADDLTILGLEMT